MASSHEPLLRGTYPKGRTMKALMWRCSLARRCAACLLLAISVAINVPAAAATMQVFPDSFGSGNCKLRQAIQAANTNTAVGGCPAGSAGTDTLVLALGRPYFIGQPGSDEDSNLSGDLDVTSSIIVQGDDTTRTVIVAQDFDRAFHVLTAQGSLTLNDVTIIGGSVLAGTSNDGGVVRKDGAATLTINRSALRGGNADRGGGLYAPPGSGLLTLNRVTVFDNHANHGGGMFLEQGSGIEAILNNVTLSGNIANQTAGGLYVANSWFRMRNSTVARNVSLSSAGGIFYGSPSTTGINIANSVLIENTANGGLPNDLNCAGGGAQLGARTHTMIGSIVGGCTFASFSGIPGSNDARLTPLFDFGSGVPTHALMPGSAALNAGNPSNANALTSCLSTDARGFSRTTSCDVGAYEHRYDLTINSFSDLPDLNPGDGSCLALGNVCTLRAALMEAGEVGGRWFIHLPPGIYSLNQPIGTNAGDPAGGDLDVDGIGPNDPALALTLFGSGDADDTQIVGGGLDRVLEVRGNNGSNDTTLAFALINARISGGLLTEDPFAFEDNPVIGGGGIKVYGGRSLFYNVVVQDNEADVADIGIESIGGGISITAPSSPEHNRPYANSVLMDRFAVIDNISADYYGGAFALIPASPFGSDGVVMRNGSIAGNHAQRGGGLATRYASLSFVSIVANTAEFENDNATTGYSAGFTGTGAILRNVLMAENFIGAERSDCRVYGPSSGDTNTSLGYNLTQSDHPACVIAGDTTGNQLGIDPLLGSRESLQGMPFYRPAATSPAVNAIPRAVCSDVRGIAVVSDAHGLPRPGDGNAFCDIGAIENELALFANGFE
jgi:hypothetical protein